MNCNYIQEVLSTDYIDGELSDGQLKLVNEHLSGCSTCLHFKEELIKRAVTPFDNSKKVIVPECIWNNIRRAIAENSNKKHLLQNIFVKFKFFPGISASSAVIILLISSFVFFNNSSNSANPSEYADDENYFAYLYEGIENTESAPSDDGYEYYLT